MPADAAAAAAAATAEIAAYVPARPSLHPVSDADSCDSSLTMEEIPVKLRCAICNLLAVNALRTPCCDQNICETCEWPALGPFDVSCSFFAQVETVLRTNVLCASIDHWISHYVR